MKVQEGVYLHLLPVETSKTNQLHLRFSAPFKKETVAGRVLAANVMEMGNQAYPTAYLFRRKLASLYGATLSTHVFRKGQIHCVELVVTYAKQAFLPHHISLLEEIFTLVRQVLYEPLAEGYSFLPSVFEMEKQQLLAYMASEVEDPFYQVDLQSRQRFFTDPHVRLPKVGTIELVDKQTPETAYLAFQEMLAKDRVDIFLVGQEEEGTIWKQVTQLGFSERRPQLSSEYQQEAKESCVEQVETKEINQTIVQLAYHLPVRYKDSHYPAFLLFNGLFGSHSHSKLFMTIRETEGLAYTIGTTFDIFTGFFAVYAGVDSSEWLRVVQLIKKELTKMQEGVFEMEEMEKTKRLVVDAMAVSNDNPSHLVERTYNKLLFPERTQSTGELLAQIQQVDKQAIQDVANKLTLQVVCVMEGEL